MVARCAVAHNQTRCATFPVETLRVLRAADDFGCVRVRHLGGALPKPRRAVRDRRLARGRLRVRAAVLATARAASRAAMAALSVSRPLTNEAGRPSECP